MSARGDVGGPNEDLREGWNKKIKNLFRIGLISFLISSMANYGAVFVSLKQGETPQGVEKMVHDGSKMSKILSPVYFIGKPARELAYWQYERGSLE